MVEQAAQRVAEKIVASAPAGWTRVVVAAKAGRGGISLSGGYTVPGTSRRHPVPSVFAELGSLAEAVRKVRGWDPMTVEIVCRPSGEYELVAFADVITSLRGVGGGFQAVLNPSYRLPPSDSGQEESTAPPAGDPELAAARFHAYMERRAAILGRPEQLPPPASAAALDRAERRIGRPLPADLRALYLIADGDGIGYEHRYLLKGNAWLALEDLVTVHADLCEPVWHGWELGWNSVAFDADPPGTVRRAGGHPAWVPFATGEDGNYLAVDLAPAGNGRPGQVIGVGRDYHECPVYVADSVTSLLGRHLELLELGAYEKHDDHIVLLDSEPRLGPERIAGELPAGIPPGLQAVHINDAASPVDLAPLTGAANLRLLHLNRCATTDLVPVRTLPVESLRVTLDGGDLTPLEGHRHLTSLELGSTTPIDIVPLRTVPNLRGLDLSRAVVRDLTVLADLPDLRYLALTARQWTALLDEGKAPHTLAAARLTDDDASLGEALTWAARLGLDTGDALRTTGSLPL